MSVNSSLGVGVGSTSYFSQLRDDLLGQLQDLTGSRAEGATQESMQAASDLQVANLPFGSGGSVINQVV